MQDPLSIPLAYWAGLFDKTLSLQFTKNGDKFRGTISQAKPVLSLVQSHFGGKAEMNGSYLRFGAQVVYQIATLLKDHPSYLQPVYQAILKIRDIKTSRTEPQDETYSSQLRAAIQSFQEIYKGALATAPTPSENDHADYLAGFIEGTYWMSCRLHKNRWEGCFRPNQGSYANILNVLGLEVKGLYGQRLISFIDRVAPHLQIYRQLYSLIKTSELTKTPDNGQRLYDAYLAYVTEQEALAPLAYSQTQDQIEILNKEAKETKVRLRREEKQKQRDEKIRAKKEAKLAKAAKREAARQARQDAYLREQEAKKAQEEAEAQLVETLLRNGQKRCPKCDEVKPLDDFAKNCRAPDGRGAYCRQCSKESYYLPHKEKHKARSRQWHENNPDKSRALRKKHAAKYAALPAYRLRRNISKRVISYVKDLSHLTIHKDVIGCSPNVLAAHIEAQLKPEWTWDNYGKIWHIDHIIPCAAFDFHQPDQLRWCWNYRNLRPLDAVENIAKTDTLPDGRNARTLKREDKTALIEVLAHELDKLGIASSQEVRDSFESLTKVEFITL